MPLMIQEQISLLPYNTLQVHAKAQFFVEIQNEEDIQSLISNEVWIRYPHIVLGGGANMLFTKDYEGLVVKIGLQGKDIIGEQDGKILVKVGAGEDWHETMMWLLDQGYVGGENLVYIPGTVGAAPIGNIGAYGKEAKDIIASVETIDLASGEKKIFSNSQCQFAYRESVFKKYPGTYLITAVIFALQKDHKAYLPDTQYKDVQEVIRRKGLDNLSALELAHIIIDIRKHKLPDWHTVGTAGSFFKNPIVDKAVYKNLLQKYPELIGWETNDGSIQFAIRNPQSNNLKIKLSAGQLIELVGLKGYKQGAIGTSENHALILINHGGGTGAQIQQFAALIQQKVLEQFAVHLEPEVIYI